MTSYPYIYVNRDLTSDSFGKWCVRADENTAYEDMPLGDAGELVMAIIDEEAAEASNVVSFPFGKNVVRFDG